MAAIRRSAGVRRPGPVHPSVRSCPADGTNGGARGRMTAASPDPYRRSPQRVPVGPGTAGGAHVQDSFPLVPDARARRGGRCRRLFRDGRGRARGLARGRGDDRLASRRSRTPATRLRPRCRSASTTPAQRRSAVLQVNAIFRRSGESLEWGSVLVRAVGREGLAPGSSAGPFTLRSARGYTGRQSSDALLAHREFIGRLGRAVRPAPRGPLGASRRGSTSTGDCSHSDRPARSGVRGAAEPVARLRVRPPPPPPRELAPAGLTSLRSTPQAPRLGCSSPRVFWMESGCRRRVRPRVSFVRLVAVLVFGWLGLGHPAAPAAQPDDAVAVVPFTNLSRQATDEWIGAGIAETVSSDLRNLGVRVVGDDGSAPDPRPFPAPGDDELLRAGRRLGAQWLVAGGYQRVGDRLRITARLVDATTGAVRRTAKIDGSLGDLFRCPGPGRCRGRGCVGAAA